MRRWGLYTECLYTDPPQEAKLSNELWGSTERVWLESHGQFATQTGEQTSGNETVTSTDT